MKIEKVSDNQFKCTLTKEDLETRHIKLSELAYGTDKAKLLFHDMMQQAFSEFGFETEDIPLMIEAIPVSRDSVVLIVTKVEDPEELDTRFSRFAPHVKDEMDEILGLDGNTDDSTNSGAGERADEILDLFRPKNDLEASDSKDDNDTETEPAAETEELSRLFAFSNLDYVIDVSHILAPFFSGQSWLYKDPAAHTYYLKISRGSTSPAKFNKACNILSEYGTCARPLSQSSEYLEEHFDSMIAFEAVSKLASI